MSLKLLTPSTATSTIYKLTTTASSTFTSRTATRIANRPSPSAFTTNRTFLTTPIHRSNMDAAQAKGTSKQANDPSKDDGWKTRPPYSVHKETDFKPRYEASCHCGKVKYQLSREEPLDSKLCHCTTCQTQHAAPFQWAAIFHKEDINFSHGHHDLEWYDPTDKSIEHKLPCKVRCSYCHSPIMDEGRNMILLFPSLVHLKTDQDKANFKPRCHMFYGQRVMDIPDGLPKWSGLSDSSDLMEDSPPELVKEVERKREEERKEKFKKGENK